MNSENTTGSELNSGAFPKAKRRLSDYLILSLKGVGMGAADVVPGVSGGTIAFITGIYQELIESLKNIDHTALNVLRSSGVKGVWQHINGNFLVALFAGIAVSVLSLANVLKFLLEEYPTLLWGFFFGLILGSSVFVARRIGKWNIKVFIPLIAGGVIAYWITILTQTSTPESYWFIFLCGMIAICAMILPGISGSFLLLIMGKYDYMIAALKGLDIATILTFMAGCVTGLLTFSHLLSWLFKKHHDLTVALLTGFMIGSLNKVWPWKETLQTYTDRHGEVKPLVQENVLPAVFEQVTGEPSLLGGVMALAIAGFGLVFVLEWVSGKSGS